MGKANGEIIEVHEIFEKNPNHIKNYGMWLRYDSRSGTHNMYKEYRDVTINAAVQKMYAEMSSRHRARKSSIQIIRTAIVKGGDVKRANIKQFIDPDIKFRMLHRVNRASSKAFKSTFKAKRPCSF